MQHHAADQLHVEMAQADGAPRCLAHGGEGFRQELLQNLGFFLTQFFVEVIDSAFRLVSLVGIHTGWRRKRLFKLLSRSGRRFSDAILEFIGLGAELGIGQTLIFRLQLTGLANIRTDAFNFTLVLGADDLFYPIDHALKVLPD